MLLLPLPGLSCMHSITLTAEERSMVYTSRIGHKEGVTTEEEDNDNMLEDMEI